MDAVKVLKAGQELKDPAKWKKGHWLLNTIGLLVAGTVGLIKWKFPDFPITDDVAKDVEQFIYYGLAIVNVYLIPATSKKIGTKPKEQ